jgi:uncharacterized membrane protein
MGGFPRLVSLSVRRYDPPGIMFILYNKEKYMLEGLYAFLEKVGFGHPLHPMLTHVPMGMIIGAVVFSLAGLIWKNQHFDRTAFHCSVLALLGIVPVIGAGILDWQHFMEGSWITLIIIKMILATLLTVLLVIAIVLKQRGAEPKTLVLVYFLCLACAGGLGYSGGELIFGG